TTVSGAHRPATDRVPPAPRPRRRVRRALPIEGSPLRAPVDGCAHDELPRCWGWRVVRWVVPGLGGSWRVGWVPVGGSPGTPPVGGVWEPPGTTTSRWFREPLGTTGLHRFST